MFRLSMDMDIDEIVTLMWLNRCRYVISEPNRCYTDGFSKLFYRNVSLVVVSYNLPDRVARLIKIHFC